MPISFQCEKCGQAMRAKDESAGKHARCPKCSELTKIPAASTVGTSPQSASAAQQKAAQQKAAQQKAAQQKAAQQKAAQQKAAQQRAAQQRAAQQRAAQQQPNMFAQPAGPASAMDSFFDDELSAHEEKLQLEEENRALRQQQEAEQKRKTTLGGNQLYATGGRPSKSSRGSAEIDPQPVNLGDVFREGTRIWQENWLFLFGAAVVPAIVAVMVLSGIWTLSLFVLAPAISVIEDNNIRIGLVICLVLGWVLVFYMTMFAISIGNTLVCLDLARGEKPDFKRSFEGLPMAPTVLFVSILAGLLVYLGMVCLIIPGIYVAFVIWPYYYLIVDEKCEGLSAISEGMNVGKSNIGNTLLLILLSMVLGLIPFVGPQLVSMIWSVYYLSIIGEQTG